MSKKQQYQKLENICARITDGTHQTPTYLDCGVVFISAKNIKGGAIDFSDVKYISREEHEILTKKNKPEPGDLLLTKSGSLGDSTVIPSLEFEFSIFESLALIKPKRDLIDSGYLKQYLGSLEARRYFHSITTGQAVKHLHLGDLCNLKVFVPPINVQIELSEKLAAWDEAISKTDSLIAEKTRYFTWLQEQLINGECSTSNFVRLGQVASIPTKTPLANIQNDFALTVKLHCKGVERNEKTRPKQTENGRPFYRRSAGEFLVGRQNIHNGGFGVIPLELDGGIASNAITSVVANPEKLSAEYLFYFFSRQKFYRQLESVMGGTGQKEMSESELMKLKIALPSIERQQQIAKILSVARKEIVILLDLFEKYRLQKAAIMKKLLTGEGHALVPEVVAA